MHSRRTVTTIQQCSHMIYCMCSVTEEKKQVNPSHLAAHICPSLVDISERRQNQLHFLYFLSSHILTHMLACALNDPGENSGSTSSQCVILHEKTTFTVPKRHVVFSWERRCCIFLCTVHPILCLIFTQLNPGKEPQ